jgi:hypothetical protein
MRRTTLNIKRCRRGNLASQATFAILLMGCFPLLAQQPGQKTFASPEEASNALVTAVQNNDERALLDLLGPDGKQIVSSGDEAEDTHSRAEFLLRYREMHRLVEEPDGTTTLYIGAKNWPTPVPLVHKANAWYFDTDAGKKEILFRRIGRNEISTIRVCQELVAAQKEYRDMQHSGYAQKIFSDEGQRDGLYWKAAAGEARSPIGPLVASAVTEPHAVADGRVPTPYRGYYFHMLLRQGKDAPGGAKAYIVNGQMTQGFAFVAFPAEYRSSGVMTFIVGSDGDVYEKELGESTSVVAKGMKTYDPGAGWYKIEETSEEAAHN